MVRKVTNFYIAFPLYIVSNVKELILYLSD